MPSRTSGWSSTLSTRIRWLSSITLVFVLLGAPAHALNPSLAVSQYAHTAWTLRGGAFKGYPRSLAQTTDGYLWLGTEFGVLRFDGVRFVPWQPPAGSRLPNDLVVNLLATRDGSLWIGTSEGLARWRNRTFTSFAALAGERIGALREDRDGTVWVGTNAGIGGSAKLCAIQQDQVRCSGGDGRLGRFVTSLYEDRSGNLWAGTGTGLWRWKPGAPQRYDTEAPRPEIHSIIGTADGTVLAAFNREIKQMIDGALRTFALPSAQPELKPTALLRDRDGGLWIGTQDQGLLHVSEGRVDHFTPRDGLSGELIADLFEDREGNVWVATLNGLDRFHDLTVASISTREGLSSDSVVSVASARDGSVWFGTAKGLNRWKDGRTSLYPSSSWVTTSAIGSLFEDSRGRLWVSSQQSLLYFEHGRVVPVDDVPTGFIHALAEHDADTLWAAHQDQGLLRLRARRVVEIVPWARFDNKSARALAVDPRAGGLWLGFFQGGIAHFKNGELRKSYGVADGLGQGEVTSLRFDDDGALWIATAGGLSRLHGGRIATLTTQNGLPCNNVHWAIEDESRARWLYLACGLVRIAEDEANAWTSNPSRKVQLTVYDDVHGAPLYATLGSYSPKVAAATDGRLWFATYRGAGMISPRRLPVNRLAPPVHIESITADGTPYDTAAPLQLSSPLRDVRIDYTAPTLVAADRVRFRYKLEGRDRDWVDAGNRRQAFYTDLGPNRYRFRVIAANNDGVWNNEGAVWEFEILPAYYQTLWFRLAAGMAVIAGGWTMARTRMRRVALQQQVRFEERLADRTRVAQELHDTLLQGFVSASMQLHVLAEDLAHHPVRSRLDRILEQVRSVIDEGREAVAGLRSHVSSYSLEDALARDAEMFRGEREIDFRVITEGKLEPLRPIIRDDVYQIAREALANAFHHGRATHIEVQLEYTPSHLRVHVRDNGCGIPPGIVETGRPGHWGIAGMRERAERIDGTIKLWSRLGAGTEVELLVRADIVYEAQRADHESAPSV